MRAILTNRRNNIELTKIGQIIDGQINNIPKRYAHVKLNEYAIMPNHIHMILKLQDSVYDKTQAQASSAPTVSAIIRSFKSKSCMAYLSYLKQNNTIKPAKIWQRSFHDHIIRTNTSLQNIRNYIMNNPITWDTDKNNPTHNNALHLTFSIASPLQQQVNSDVMAEQFIS